MLKEGDRSTNTETVMPKFHGLHILLICSCFIGICTFLYGFFPIKYVSREISSYNDLPSSVMDIRVDPKEFYFSRINPLVFIVIDALRWDFFSKSEYILNAPYISNLLNTDQACLFHAECSPPTVTMPRLKALMTGSMPNFIDVILNLGSSQIRGDSLMIQAVENNKTVVFYGDDTWLKMFPFTFLRSEGTSSFFVSDYEEVDLNVTRNIPQELHSTDWDIMILHYLGLDHIGHLAGPSSPLVGPKLQEMDQVVEMIVKGLKKMEKNGSLPLLIIAGDHGMRNSGGHGGSTTDEILTTLLFVQHACSDSKRFKQRVWQTDVTPTLAVLLGLPIPHNSIGTLIPGALTTLPSIHQLYAQHYNSDHLKNLSVPMNCFREESMKYLEEAQEKFADLLKSNTFDPEIFEQSYWLYESASVKMSQCMANSDAGFHVLEMVAACCIFLAIIVTIFLNLVLGIKTSGLTKSVLVIAVILIALADCFIESAVTILVVFLTVTVSAYLSSLWMSSQIPVINLIVKISGASTPALFLCAGCILHAGSLFASSLVEEEHQTWYFLWITLNLIKLFSISSQILSKGRLAEKNVKSLVQVMCLMAGHRFLRSLNQTGDKWVDLPDFGDWLRQPENWLYHFFFTCAGLAGVWASLLSLNKSGNTFYKLASAAALLFVLLCRAANAEVKLPFIYPLSKGVTEVTLFWLLSLTLFIYQTWQTSRVVESATSATILMLTLVLRPHNIVVLPFLRFASHLIFAVYPSLFEVTLVHAWMGSAAFFYQGNSNSLTTVDVAAGYIGAADSNLLRVGLLVFLHTFGGPILSFFLLINRITQERHLRRNLHTSLQVFTLQKLIPLFVSCFICVVLRHHLFVWSVFAPKLLYEMASTVAVLLLVLPFWLILSLRETQRFGD